MFRWSRFPQFLLLMASFSLGSQTVKNRTAFPSSLPPVNGVNIVPLTGRLTVGIPVGSVPGDIPIPLNYRINGSPMTQRVDSWGTVLLPGWDGHTPPAPPIEFMMEGVTWEDRPAFGSLHFGYVVNASFAAPPNGSNGCTPVPDPAWYVLEDGRIYSDADLLPYTNYNSTFTLDQDFFNSFGTGLQSPGPAAMQISNDWT